MGKQHADEFGLELYYVEIVFKEFQSSLSHNKAVCNNVLNLKTVSPIQG